jgi:hypothetical protein
MSCRDARDWMHRRLDGEFGEPPPGLDAHLAGCRDCRELLAFAGRLEEGVRRLPCPAPPPDLAGRITARVLFRQRQARTWRRAAAVVSLAAAALLAIWLVRPAAGPTISPATPGGEVARRGPPPRPVPSLQRQVEEAGQAVVSLTRRAADETVGPTRAFIPDLSIPPVAVASADRPATDTARSLREVGQNVSAGLEPVTTSARRAFSLFLRELPPVGPDGKSKS